MYFSTKCKTLYTIQQIYCIRSLHRIRLYIQTADRYCLSNLIFPSLFLLLFAQLSDGIIVVYSVRCAGELRVFGYSIILSLLLSSSTSINWHDECKNRVLTHLLSASVKQKLSARESCKCIYLCCYFRSHSKWKICEWWKLK